MTCAKNRASEPYSGAGPPPKNPPAPEMCATCAKMARDLLQSRRLHPSVRSAGHLSRRRWYKGGTVKKKTALEISPMRFFGDSNRIKISAFFSLEKLVQDAVKTLF